MSLDEQLSELLTSLGVTLEEPDDPAARRRRAARERLAQRRTQAQQQAQQQALREQPAQPAHDDQPMGAMDAMDTMDQKIDQLAPMASMADPVEESVSAYQHPGDWEDDDELLAQAELSLFQTSREHYGVFYRLDLVSGAPQLRIFAPDEEGALKMRCYLVRPALGAPLRDWFLSSRAHNGSEAYSASRETIEQHLLFAAGEALKRLFWSGEPERMRFPHEIEVERVA